MATISQKDAVKAIISKTLVRSGEIVDIQQQIKLTGVFEPLKDPNYFAQVKVNPELGNLQWPNGADLDPDVSYKVITKSQSGALPLTSPPPFPTI